MSHARSRVPGSTYRLQLHAGFTFEHARELLPYLERLGVTHLYLSPLLAATPGSEHGYDVVDPTRLNPELGGEASFEALANAAHGRGMGLVVDIVPNHMGVGTDANPWWNDVLRHGRASDFARFFDIDWESPLPELHGRVLLPVLGDELDEVLRRGELTLERAEDGEGGEACLRYFDRRLPLAPSTTAVLEGSAEGPEGLRALLERQHYRLEYWRTAQPRVNYRRFFTIDGLAAMRVEDPEVFEATHALILDLVRRGLIDGLRVDHVDGLADPLAYLERLRAATPGYLVVEKILAADEELPEAWPIDGTTGYEFMNDVTRLSVDPAAVPRLHAVYERFTGRSASFEEISVRTRRAVLDGPLAGQVERVSARLYSSARVAERGVGPAAWSEAIRALLSAMPVYRTYTTEAGVDPRAPAVLDSAAEVARRWSPDLDPQALEVATEVLARPPERAVPDVMALQQYSPATQAKGIEDAALYRYMPLLALNDVGGDPEAGAMSVRTFHRRNAERLERWPASMIATATHDNKRGEDVSARLNVLADLPDDWAELVEDWSRLVRPEVGPPGPDIPDRHAEYLVYQTLLGVWPPTAPSPEERANLQRRVTDYAVKAAREAGEHTSWVAPDPDLEARLGDLVRVASGGEAAALLDDPAGLLGRVRWLGAINSLAQTVLRVTSPGVPDTYRGTELWDLTLVDPDNRRPVDYSERTRLLEGFGRALEEGDTADLERRALWPRLLADWPSGAVKLYVLAQALRLRRRLHPLFLEGSYAPLRVAGAHEARVVAFARERDESRVLVLATLRAAALLGPSEVGTWTPEWADTRLELDAASVGGRYRDAITGATVALDSPVVPLARVLGGAPVALLERMG